MANNKFAIVLIEKAPLQDDAADCVEQTKGRAIG